MKKYLTELLGAFLLTLVVSLSLTGKFPVPTPVLAALTLGLFVYTAGHISGAHLNPAVTVGVWSLGKINLKDAVSYIIAQFIGAGLAMLVARYFATAPALAVVDTLPVVIAEFLGTFFFTFGIAAVVLGKVPTDVVGITIGGSLLLGLSIAAVASNAVINPAVALGIGSFSASYLIAPVVGSLAGMNACKWLAK